MQHITLNMPAKCQKVEKALEICSRFQIYKKSMAQGKSEVGASVTFQDQTTPSRITKNETDIIRLSNRLQSLESKSPTSTKQDTAAFQPRYSGHSPRPKQDFSSSRPRDYPQKGNFSARRDFSPGRYRDYDRRDSSSAGSSNRESYNGNTYNRDNNFRRGSFDRSSDRRDRFRTRGRGNFNRNNPNRSQERRDSSQQASQPAQQAQPTQQASLEEGLALQTDCESGPEDLDDTVAQFERLEEMDQQQRFDYFCHLKDQAKSGN